MELRKVKSVSYNCLIKRQKAKTSDERPCTAFVYVSQFSKRVEKHHLIIGDALFIHNGRPYQGQEFATFKCRIAECNVRAKIAYTNLDEAGHQPAFVNGSHCHPLNSVKELKLARGGFTRDGEEIQYVPASAINGDLAVPEKEGMKSIEDLETMLDADIRLSETEKREFERMFYENQENAVDLSKSFYETLRVGAAKKFGLGVFATIDIPKSGLLGFFYGRLCRKLPENSRYSFNVSLEGEEELHVNAENSSERNKLAMINHECKRFNAKVYLSGTKEGLPSVEFIATKKIKAGSEIFINYGRDYFDKTLICKCSTHDPK